MELEWDPRKAEANYRKHGVRFSDAESVLEDRRAITVEDPHPHEERWVTIGLDGLGRVLVVAYAWRHERVRVISARRATPRERKEYGRQP